LTQGASTCAFKKKETKLAPSPLLLLGCLVLLKTCVSSLTLQEHVQNKTNFSMVPQDLLLCNST
jgi:hypothetical protein